MEENNQLNPEKNNPNKRTWKFYAVWGIILLILGSIFYSMYIDIKEHKRSAENFQTLYFKEQSANFDLKMKVNSAEKKIEVLSGYWSLTSTMIDRDNARKNLKYQPGDFAIMKVDSSKVLVTDIIAGGDKYNYTLQYEVQKSDESYKRVSPNLLY